jgi:UDP-N-acetylglucosamine 4,6-dehydratase
MDMEINSFLKGKLIVITGGTGSFGHEITNQLLKTDVKGVTIFSRDEKKQYDMRNEIQDNRLLFELGDVRDADRVEEVIHDKVDIVYHAAALKQVPYCEDYPMEAVKTNIFGAENVRRAAIKSKVKLVLAISTDKAVKPVNVMGMTKAVQEKIFTHPTKENRQTKLVCVRYGNVIGSRGSVIPLFHDRLAAGKPLRITCGEMTRFWLTLSEAVELVFYASVYGNDGDLFVRKMPACEMIDLANIMIKCSGKNVGVEITGVRSGEKIHEILVSEEEMRRSIENDLYFRIARFGTESGCKYGEYSSNTVRRMQAEEIKDVLTKEGWL